jgi:predicted DNA-binding transcriptional regulator YafY
MPDDGGLRLEPERTSDRASAKHDRLARFYRVLHYLRAHPEGATPDAVAGFTGMSRRTVYRDLQALEGEIGIPLWSEEGRWGIVDGAFLPPLRLTRRKPSPSSWPRG